MFKPTFGPGSGTGKNVENCMQENIGNILFKIYIFIF